jgi:hypothetical protein
MTMRMTTIMGAAMTMDTPTTMNMTMDTTMTMTMFMTGGTGITTPRMNAPRP